MCLTVLSKGGPELDLTQKLFRKMKVEHSGIGNPEKNSGFVFMCL